MKTLTRLTNTTAGINRNGSRTLAACVFLALATASQATPITGDPQGNSFAWAPASTNALNYLDLAPGHLGQGAPYVLFNSSTLGSVTLDFYNLGNNGLAFFETRIDGIDTGTSAHPVVGGDTIHTGGTAVTTLAGSVIGKTFSASNYVDIRLALGGERDYDFDWVRFEVAPAASVPDAGGTLALLSVSLAGIGFARRKK